MRDLTFVAALVVGAPLIASGVGKLRDVPGFVEVVGNYRMLPGAASTWFARLLPGVEVLLGASLVVGTLPMLTGSLALILFSSFLAGVGTNLVRGRRITCGCFGASRLEPISWVTVLRLTLMLGCAGAVAGSEKTAWLAAPPENWLLDAVISGQVLVILQLLRSVPTLVRVWRIKFTPDMTLRGHTIQLRELPLMPFGAILREGNSRRHDERVRHV